MQQLRQQPNKKGKKGKNVASAGVTAVAKHGSDSFESAGDVLDADAAEANWLTGIPYSDNYKKWALIWKKLPLYADGRKLSELIHALDTRSVTIVISGTGSGKTVIVPKLALKYAIDAEAASTLERYLQDEDVERVETEEHERKKRGNRVVITNPKSSIAEWNARFAAETLDVEVGQEVGYAYRGASHESHGSRTRLLFTTDGYLVAHNRNDPSFRDYSVIIIDEAHERTVYIDTLLFMLRRAVQIRPELRVVIISATIDPALFTTYFTRQNVNTALIEVSGLPNKPVESIFMNDGKGSGGDYLKGIGMKAVAAALKNTLPGENILFFVPTSRDAEKGCREVRDACRKSVLDKPCARMECATLYSKLSKEKQDVAKSQVAVMPYDRKIIFATNIAESSLTLNSLVTVIDSGMELESSWIPEYHCTRMQRVMSSQAQMKQRKGRVGRTRPGTCYHLYTEEQMRNQPMYPDPAIITVDLTDDILTMSAMEANGFEAACADFADFITPPTPTQIASATSVLTFYRMIAIKDTEHPAAVSTAKEKTEREERGKNKTEKATVDLIPKKNKKNNKNRSSGGRNATTETETGSIRRGIVVANDGRASHFFDVDFSVMLLPRPSPPHPASLADIGERYVGRITELGRIALDVMRKSKMGLWNSLLLVGGMAFTKDDPSLSHSPSHSDATHGNVLDDAAKLSSILEECGGDYSLLWYDESKASKVLRNVEGRMHPTSEHASLLALFDEISGPRKSEYGREGIVSEGLINKIVRRIEDTQRAVRSMRRAMHTVRNAEADVPLIASLRAIDDKDMSPLIKCVVMARLYHMASTSDSSASSNKSDNNNNMLTTRFTLKPLTVKAPERVDLLRNRSPPRDLKNWVVLYDTCMMSSMGTRMRTLTYVEKRRLRTLCV
jgi:hypothetical protein